MELLATSSEHTLNKRKQNHIQPGLHSEFQLGIDTQSDPSQHNQNQPTNHGWVGLRRQWFASKLHSTGQAKTHAEMPHWEEDSTCSGHGLPPGLSPVPRTLPPASDAAFPAGLGGAVPWRPLPRHHHSSDRRFCNIMKTGSWARQPTNVVSNVLAQQPWMATNEPGSKSMVHILKFGNPTHLFSNVLVFEKH